MCLKVTGDLFPVNLAGANCQVLFFITVLYAGLVNPCL